MNGKVFFLLLICRSASSFSEEELCDGLNADIQYTAQRCEECRCDYARKTCTTPSCYVYEEPICWPGEGACCPYCPEGYPTTRQCSDSLEYWNPDTCETCSCYGEHTICTGRVGPCPPTQCANPIPGQGSCCPICPGETQPTPPEACAGNWEGDFWKEPHGCGICTCKSGRIICSIEEGAAMPCAKAISVTGVSCPDGTHCDPDRCPSGYEFNTTTCKCQCKMTCDPGWKLNLRCCTCDYCPLRYCGEGWYSDQEKCECMKCGTSDDCEEGSYFSSDGYTCKCMPY